MKEIVCVWKKLNEMVARMNERVGGRVNECERICEMRSGRVCMRRCMRVGNAGLRENE